MFERYTERARRAIFFSRAVALRREAQQISTRDLLMGLTCEDYGESSPLHGMHGRAEELSAALAFPRRRIGPWLEHDIPLTNESKRAVAYAAEEAGEDGRYSIDVEHLFRGVLLEDRSVAKILANCGYSLKSLRAASQEAHLSVPDGGPDPDQRRGTMLGTTRYARPAPFWRRHLVLLITMLVVTIVVGIVYTLE